MEGRTIKQIMPSSGWFAKYKKGGQVDFKPIAVFFIEERDQDDDIVDAFDGYGLDLTDQPSCMEQDDFVKFVHESELKNENAPGGGSPN